MRRSAAAMILIISLFMANPAIAEPFEDATNAYINGDYETAYRLIKPSAEQGSPYAQFNLGVLYDNGRGVPQDYAEAMKWYRKAADQGYTSAQYNLGHMYDNGRGVPQDYTEAAKWYRKAADQGDMSAQYNLGRMYDNGRGVPKDYAEAVQWYRKAADQGHADAQNKLGLMYILGQGVGQDYVFAHMWLNLAAPRLPASERVMAEKKRDIIASMMTPDQIAEAQRLAREFKPRKTPEPGASPLVEPPKP